MTFHDPIILAAWIVAAGILSSIAQLLLLKFNPSAKRLIYLERRVSEMSKQLGIEEAPPIGVQELIVQGRKINAVKLYREQTGASLGASKDAIDAMEAQMKTAGLA